MTETKKDRRGRDWRSFEEARAYVQGLGLMDWLEWRAWTTSEARPRDIPSNPYDIYIGTGWVSLSD